MEALLLRDITAASCAEAFFSGWIARYGIPDIVTSDWGRQFISGLGSVDVQDGAGSGSGSSAQIAMECGESQPIS
jgi:hypothetical protein